MEHPLQDDVLRAPPLALTGNNDKLSPAQTIVPPATVPVNAPAFKNTTGAIDLDAQSSSRETGDKEVVITPAPKSDENIAITPIPENDQKIPVTSTPKNDEKVTAITTAEMPGNEEVDIPVLKVSYLRYFCLIVLDRNVWTSWKPLPTML